MKVSHMMDILKISKKHFSFWFTIPLVMVFSNVITRKRKGKVIGFLIYSFKKIHYLAVARKHRKNGHGLSMMKQVIKKIRYLHVVPKNTHAIRFYKRLGFKRKRTVHSLFGKRVEMSLY